MDSQMDFLVDFYGIREPFEGELDFFRKRPEVAGMATEDNKIIINPFSSLSKKELNAVARNEAIRLYLKENKVKPNFELTEEQQKMFSGTEYEKDPLSAKQSILDRILTNDPSAKDATLDQ
ncbi:MAG: hypothetical protein ACO22R_10275, partial [Chitinophagaceae bacterium]